MYVFSNEKHYSNLINISFIFKLNQIIWNFLSSTWIYFYLLHELKTIKILEPN